MESDLERSGSQPSKMEIRTSDVLVDQDSCGLSSNRRRHAARTMGTRLLNLRRRPQDPRAHPAFALHVFAYEHLEQNASSSRASWSL